MRRLFKFGTFMSLVLLVGTAALWIRSYWWTDELALTYRGDGAEQLRSWRGTSLLSTPLLGRMSTGLRLAQSSLRPILISAALMGLAQLRNGARIIAKVAHDRSRLLTSLSASHAV